MDATVSDNFMENWLATGTTSREIVSLCADQVALREAAKLADRHDELEREVARLAKSTAVLDRSLGDIDPRTALLAEMAEIESAMEAMSERIAASSSQWEVRALTRAELRRIADAHPEPLPPQRPPLSAPLKVKEEWEGRLAAWRREATVAGEERTLAEIAVAVVSVTTPTASASSVTVEQLRTLLDAEYGDARIRALSEAVKSVSEAETEVPRPKLLNGSEPTQE